MKNIISFELFEAAKTSAEKIADLRVKGKQLDQKRKEIKHDAGEIAQAQRSEEDPMKAELLSLNIQKLSMQSEIAKLEMKIASIKIKIEADK